MGREEGEGFRMGCRLLGVIPFVLKVRSWSGNEFPINL